MVNKLMNWLRRIFGKKTDTATSPSLLVVAEVITVQKHPNADRLKLARLFDGKEEIYPVVCGGANLAEGQKVAFARPGFHVPRSHHGDSSSFVLEKATIRGVESQGMICSRFELGLSESQDEGIWVLPEDSQPGTQVNL